jgi:hypothetical protein
MLAHSEMIICSECAFYFVPYGQPIFFYIVLPQTAGFLWGKLKNHTFMPVNHPALKKTFF